MSQFLKNLNTHESLKLSPWPHWQFDNFFPEQDFRKYQEKLCSVKSNFRKRSDDGVDINYMFLPDMNLVNFFLGDDFWEFVEKMTGKKLEIYEKSLVQLRRMDDESPAFPNHIDSQDERSLVCLFYLSPDWQPGNGGELCLNQSEEIEIQSAQKMIAPLENRMVFFFSDDTHWHSVNKVQNWERYTVVSEWIVIEESV